jgi:cytidylate kinase
MSSAEGRPATSDHPGGPFIGVVALDGPSGTGKSTVARRLAVRLGARYLDTGAMYRAATLAVLRAQVSLTDPVSIASAAAAARIDVGTDVGARAVRLDGLEVTDEIRGSAVTAAVSAVSAVSAVREQLVAEQRRLIGDGGIVVEGRDIGSVVWPAARPKVYLTASESERARRRAGELGSATAELGAVQDDLHRRDQLDSSRATSPLTQASDAIVLDTTEMDIDSVVDHLVDMVANLLEVERQSR